MRILLAGITGYLGGYIANELLERTYYVGAIARSPEKIKEKLREYFDEQRFKNN